MIIVNADDWGMTPRTTDAALACCKAGRVTSVSAMVFMEDSERAAALAKASGIDVGLHLNLSYRFTGSCSDKQLIECQNRIASFLTKSKYAVLLYNPSLRSDFRYVYQAQLQEFLRLYGMPPSHVDGHHHKHLCMNMIIDKIIPPGEKVRRNFTFLNGEKGLVKQIYRRQMDRWLAQRYVLTDYFFALPNAEDLPAVAALSRKGTLEMMSHPAKTNEYQFLMSDLFRDIMHPYITGTYSSLTTV